LGLLLAGVDVRVMLAGELPVRASDLFLGRGLRYSQHGVVVLEFHGQIWPKRSRPPMPLQASESRRAAALWTTSTSPPWSTARLIARSTRVVVRAHGVTADRSRRPVAPPPASRPPDLEGHLQDLRPTREQFRRDNGCDSVGRLRRQPLLYLARRLLAPAHDQTT